MENNKEILDELESQKLLLDDNVLIKQSAIKALRDGDFDFALKAIERGEASIPGLVEDLKIYQAELEVQNEELRESQLISESAVRRFSNLFASLPIPALMIDELGVVYECNEMASQLFKLEHRQLRSQYFPRMVKKQDHGRLRKLINAAKDQGQAMISNVALEPADAAIFIADLHIALLPKQAETEPRFVITIVDQTEKIAQRNALESGRQHFMAYFDAAPLGMAATSAGKGWIEVNHKLCEMLGYTEGELLKKTWLELTHPDDVHADVDSFNQLVSREIDSYNRDKRFIRKDGTILESHLAVSCLRKSDGSIDYFVSILEDISVRKQAEINLREREAHLRFMLENSPIAVRITNMETGKVKFANQDYAKLTNLELDAVVGFDPRIFYANPQDYLDVIDSIKKGERVTNKLIELANFSEPSKPKWTLASYMPITFENESSALGWFYDITEQKQDEKFEQFRSNTLLLLGSLHPSTYILDAIVRGIEEFNTKMLCSILLLDKEGKHFCHGIAPSLPDFYNAALDGIEIGIGVGSCGTAAYTGERVIVEDIQTHPYWMPYKELAASAGLGACWSQPIHSSTGKVLGTFAIYHTEAHTPTANDIYLIEQSANLASIAIERKQAELELKIAAIAFESQEGMMVTDANNVILRVNHAFTSITGYSSEEVIGHTPKLLSSRKHDKAFYISMWASINNIGAWEGEIWNRRKSGEVYPEHLTITAVKDAGGIITNYVATLTDITLSKAASEKIMNLAFYDPLTQLPNRRLFLDRLNQALVSSVRSGRRGALLFLDLDHFKTLNDTLGHDVGDLLLQQVAVRLSASVREGDTIARLGGDEFVVLLKDLSEEKIEAAAQTKDVTEKILFSLNQPYQLKTHTHHSTSSIGATLFNGDELVTDELLKQADIAMYQSKIEGRNTLRFYDPKMQEAITTRVDLERDLRQAIEQQQFQLYYQIQVNSLGQPLGAETLIRWIHPERKMIPPLQFIPLAEETGLILPIGQWVLETACAQLAVWRQNVNRQDLILSVNVSAKQFHQANFVTQVQETLQRHGIDPTKLKLELTESMLVRDIDDIIEKMNALSQIGINFSLDDFGTGYSSLQYLKKLPLSQLKIDQSFVRDIVTDKSDQAIVRTIIAMAYNLDIDVIAEGVETNEQRKLLLNSGCTHYQGYLFGKPVPIEEFEALLRKN